MATTFEQLKETCKTIKLRNGEIATYTEDTVLYRGVEYKRFFRGKTYDLFNTNENGELCAMLNNILHEKLDKTNKQLLSENENFKQNYTKAKEILANRQGSIYLCQDYTMRIFNLDGRQEKKIRKELGDLVL